MNNTLSQLQAINDLASHLYDFLPGKPHPYANQNLSFPGVASSLGLHKFWPDGSKRPAIVNLLSKTLEHERGRFCDLLLEIVKSAMSYRSGKNPISRESIRKLNEIVQRIGFKIPELWDPKFLDSLPREEAVDVQKENIKVSHEEMAAELVGLSQMTGQQRGYAFEIFLNRIFEAHQLMPRMPFRLAGEQIDGSLQLQGQTYLVEAKWQNKLVGISDLLTFRGKVEGKATWSRGIFISHDGFSLDGLTAFSKGRPTNIIGFTGQDLYLVATNRISLSEAIELKARKAAEQGDFYIALQEFIV